VFTTRKVVDGERIPVARALDGESGFGLSRDYRSTPCLRPIHRCPNSAWASCRSWTPVTSTTSCSHNRISALLTGVLVLAGSLLLYSRISPAVSRQARTRLHLDEAQRIGRIGSWEYDIPRGTLT
jgi:hypothetical protein